MIINEKSSISLIKDFVHKEVKANISDMTEFLFAWGDTKYASYDEWENMYEPICPVCGELLEVSENSPIICDCCNENIDADSVNMEQVEICEYWLVSQFLGEMLLKHGEPIYKRNGSWVWGRKCTGQAIFLDGVIQEIARKVTLLISEGVYTE